MTPNPSVMLKTAMGKQLYRSRVARSAVVPERSLRSSGSPWAKARDDFGRQIDVMTYGLVACRETEKETKDAFQEVLYDGNGGAAGNVIKIALSGASQSFDHAREMSERSRDARARRRGNEAVGRGRDGRHDHGPDRPR